MRSARPGGLAAGLAALASLTVALAGAAGQAARAAEPAATVTAPGPVPMGPAGIVRIVASRGVVTVRTWDRPSVQIGNGAGLDVRRSVATIQESQSLVPILAGRVEGPHGSIDLPEDTFAVSNLSEGAHDVVTIRADDASSTVDVPQNAALVTVVMESGLAILRNYHGTGAFVARVRTGSIRLIDVTGEGFVQVLRGPIVARRSSFARLRVRSGTGSVTFERCHAKQIEVSSVEGSIVYDDGSFEPGLARFESQHGDVAIGVNGASRLSGRASGGRVYTLFDRAVQIDNKDAQATATAVTAGGGPVVNASSGSGNVYLYDGALRTRAHLPPEWSATQATLRRALQRRRAENAGVAAPPPPASRAAAGAVPPAAHAGPPHHAEREGHVRNAPRRAPPPRYRRDSPRAGSSRARSSVQPSVAA
ncbi:MAG: hypothetical protein ABI346_09050 [Candidatus Baltobacteraceae bacterium]